MRALGHAISVRVPMCLSQVLLEVVSMNGMYCMLVPMNSYDTSAGVLLPDNKVFRSGVIVMVYPLPINKIPNHYTYFLIILYFR